jgi:arsenite methyltransferase
MLKVRRPFGDGNGGSCVHGEQVSRKFAEMPELWAYAHPGAVGVGEDGGNREVTGRQMTRMILGSACRVYEHLAATDLAVEGIRPGGLELTERALAWCAFPATSRILDVGTGNGVTLNQLSCRYDFAAIGVDLSHHLLNQARLKNRALSLVRGSGENLPFTNEFADGLFAECSLSVMDDPGRALDEFRRVLRIGGKLILSDVYARNPDCIDRLARTPRGCCLRGAISRTQILERLKNRDFEIDLWEDHTYMLTRFAVKLIFSYGSMNNFWRKMSPASIDTKQIKRTVSEAKPGYFLLIARKTG